MSKNSMVPFVLSYQFNLSRSWPLRTHSLGHMAVISWQKHCRKGIRWCNSFWPLTLTFQSGLSDVMHKLSCDRHYVSAFRLYVFTLHCINSIFIILLMSICISVLLVWISIKMFKPRLWPLQSCGGFCLFTCSSLSILLNFSLIRVKEEVACELFKPVSWLMTTHLK